MIQNYFKIAWRNIRKHRLFAIVNTLCLTIGLSFSLIIGAYLINQWQVNKDLKNINSQYLVKSNWSIKDMGMEQTTIAPLVKALHDEYPNLIENYYRYNPVTNIVSSGDKAFKEEIAIGDTSFVTMYGFPLVAGDKANVFPNNNSAVITANLANKLFGSTNIVGKRISVATTVADQPQDYIVSAVLADMPYNSVFSIFDESYNVFLPNEGNRYFGNIDALANWNDYLKLGMIQLKADVLPAQLKLPIKNLLKKYTDKSVQDNLTVELAPIKDYYTSNINVRRMLVALAFIAIFILVMAIINYVNINIGMSGYRLKEIGLRKVFGSRKKQLIIQFMTESLLLTGIAAVASLFLYEVSRPLFSNLLNTKFQHVWNFDLIRIALYVMLLIVVSLLSGLYPAFVLSSLSSIQSIKGKLNSTNAGQKFRHILITIQFTLATIVLITAFNINRQVSYVFNKDLGYNREGVLVLSALPKRWDSTVVLKMLSIKDGMKQLPVVKAASLSFEIPDRLPPGAIDISIPGNPNPIYITTSSADKDYAAVFGLKLKTGEFFNQKNYTPGEVVINESAVKALGFTTENAIGKEIKWQSVNTSFIICGVVKDFNYSGLQEKIQPFLFTNTIDQQAYRYLTVRVQSPDLAAATEQIKTKWRQMNPGAPFEYIFMEDKFKTLYQSELQLKAAAQLGSVINLVIIFMGIFGVVAFTLARRNKEIAVRKVLGADMKGIILLIVKDYGWLILIANLIAWPAGYIVSDRWLQNYAYRVGQTAWPYLLAAVGLFLIAFVFIAIQSYKTASSNPIKSLRTE